MTGQPKGQLKEQPPTGYRGAADIVVFQTTCPASDAPALAEDIVRSRLAACVNVSAPFQSFYEWEKEFTWSDECTLTIKTSHATRDRLFAHLLDRHPYSLPEIVFSYPHGVLLTYRDWVAQQSSER